MFNIEIRKHLPLVKHNCSSWVFFEHHNTIVGMMWWCYKMNRDEYTGTCKEVYCKKIGEE